MIFRFDSLAAFIAMDGHGFYIWVSYLITALVMGWLVATPLLRKNQLFKALKRQQTLQGQHKGSVNAGSEERAP